MLDKVFFKILASETDLDFEENLRVFLPKLLLKLTSNEDIVRKKVSLLFTLPRFAILFNRKFTTSKIMEILVHVNKRIKSRPNVQLPLENLLNMFNDTNLSKSSFFAVLIIFK